MELHTILDIAFPTQQSASTAAGLNVSTQAGDATIAFSNVSSLSWKRREGFLATGSVVLHYGDFNDKCGEMARLAVHRDSAGQGLGGRVIDALFKVAENTLEFALGEARTAHNITQEMLEDAGFALIGFVPQYFIVNGRREGLVLYAKLQGNGVFLRSEAAPSVISEAATLARFVLFAMNLNELLIVADEPLVRHDMAKYAVPPIDRSAIGPLLRIPTGRIIDPYGTPQKLDR